MAIITKPQGPSSHWYHKDGTPQHRMRLTDGDGSRPTHLGDARKLGLYPSVSSIIGILDKPGLSRWKVNQAILAVARAEKRKATETDKFYCDRVRDLAYQQVDDAAELGTAIHHEIERFLTFDHSKTQFVAGTATLGEGKDQRVIPLGPYVEPIIRWMQSKQITVEKAEQVIVNHQYGYAGTADAPYRSPKSFGILDYKSRKTEAGVEIEAWPEQALQIAAYFVGYWGEAALDDPKAWGGNIFTSTTEPGRIQVIMYPRSLLKFAWLTFRELCTVWKYFNRFDPTLDPTSQPVWPVAVSLAIASPDQLPLAASSAPAPVPDSAPAPVAEAGKPVETMLDVLNRCKQDNHCDGVEFLSPHDCAHFTPGKIKTIYAWYYHAETGTAKVGLTGDAALGQHGWTNAFFAYPKQVEAVDAMESKIDKAKAEKAASRLRLKELEKMPAGFGKFRETLLREVPSSYLDWLRDQVGKPNNKIPAHVKEYLARPDVNKSIDQDLERKDRK